MSRQITLSESVEDVRQVKLDEGIEAPGEVSEDSTIICGSCGAAMKKMGPASVTKKEYDGIEYDRASWQFSCRACGHGSAKINLNPVPPMLEIEDNYFQNYGGNIIEIESGLSGGHQLLPFSSTEKRNGYSVHPRFYDEEKHEDTEPPSKEVKPEQVKVFEF